MDTALSTKGSKYDSLGEYPGVAAIAKAIREDIKQAKADGLIPKNWKVSVRSNSFSMGCSIDVTVRDCVDAWQDCTGIIPGTEVQGVCFDGTTYTTADACRDPWCAAKNDPNYAHAAKIHKTQTAEARAAEEILRDIHRAYNHDNSDAMTDYFDVRYYGQVSFEGGY
jgi:hypothetical protein